jgi:formate C-acetyltransferase
MNNVLNELITNPRSKTPTTVIDGVEFNNDSGARSKFELEPRLVEMKRALRGHYHCGLGRFDQYMWPYLKKDLDLGRIDINGAEQLLAEFFLSLNKDSDLYPGIQQGDNGQSLMLGGVKRDGSSGVNGLTYMVLRVARGAGMIDPKINLRVTKDTSLDLLELAAELTQIGLGFCREDANREQE